MFRPPFFRKFTTRQSQSRPRPRQSFRPFRHESLEERRLLTITVDTLVDEADGSITDGDVSLRDAIALAPSGETINFSVNGTILLTLGELVIDKDLTIDGPGAELLTIDASGNDPTPDSTLDDGDNTNDGDGSRVIDIDDGDNEFQIGVTIRGVSIAGGDSSEPGGGLRSGENLQLYDSVLSGNISISGGGGLHVGVNTGTSVVERTTITNNWAAEGGGINARTYGGQLTISDSTISGNSLPQGGGGGLLLWAREGSTVEVVDSTITGNATNTLNGVGGKGGGITCYLLGGSDLTVAGCDISNNIADAFGSGLSVNIGSIDGGVFLLEDCLVSNNLGMVNSTSSGAISVISVVGTTIIRRTTVSGNTDIGIKVSASQYANVSLTDCAVTENDRGIDLNSSFGSTARIERCNISGNTGPIFGGGVKLTSQWPGSIVSIQSSTISNNAGRSQGGGLFVRTLNGGETVIDSSTVSGNSAWRDGGGIFIDTQDESPVSIRSSTIVDNAADYNGNSGGVGGGIYAVGTTSPIILNTVVAKNEIGVGTDGDVTGAVDPTSHHNLIGVDTGLTGITNGTNGNIIGTAAVPIDPMLGPLQDNGGPTPTHAPLPGSPVIDAGEPAFVGPPYADQRGYYRVVDGNGDMTARIDIGAVEYASIAVKPGDGNLDGAVDGLDYILWAMHFGDDPAEDPPGAPLNGDYNNDGVVDGLDYIVWAENFEIQPSSAIASPTAALSTVKFLTAAVSEPLAVDAVVAADYGAGATTSPDLAIHDWQLSRAFDVVLKTLHGKRKDLE